MSSLYITPGEPGWEDILSYECKHSRHILLQKTKGNADGLMVMAHAILKKHQFERKSDQNSEVVFVSYQKVAAD